jgi:hypothetical protein
VDWSQQAPGGGDPLRPGGPGLNPHYPWIVVHQGYTVLVSRQDGVVVGVGREGLWDYDTRGGSAISGFRVRGATPPARSSPRMHSP